MKIFVKTPDGKTVGLEVGAVESVRSGKAKIEHVVGLSSDQQRWIFNGKELEDFQTLGGVFFHCFFSLLYCFFADCNLGNGSTLQLSLRLLGGVRCLGCGQDLITNRYGKCIKCGYQALTTGK
jgi:hypothetical protein